MSENIEALKRQIQRLTYDEMKEVAECLCDLVSIEEGWIEYAEALAAFAQNSQPQAQPEADTSVPEPPRG
jgi:hypothetical protein